MGFVLLVPVRDHDLLFLFFVRFNNHHSLCGSLLANDGRKFPQQQCSRRHRLSQSQSDQLDRGFAPAFLLWGSLIMFSQRSFCVLKIAARTELAKDVNCTRQVLSRQV